MPNSWIAWSTRNKEFAPVLGLHKHHMFFPTRVEAFLEKECELRTYLGFDSARSKRIYGSVREFSQGSLQTKIQWMLHPLVNKKNHYLDRYGGKTDLKRSRTLQKGEPHQVYVRGFRNKETDEAYITYWFFYVENFVPKSTKDETIAKVLSKHPDNWTTHEGDWEAISVYFANYKDSNPTQIFLSQHEVPQKIAWKNVETQDGRILVMPAIGSHANFNQPIRTKRLLIFAEVASADKLIYPEQGTGSTKKTYILEELNPKKKHLWLHFKGRWGQSSGEFGIAPTGPLMKRLLHFKLLADVKEV